MIESVQVELYQPSHKQLWDDFVRSSRNGTFLFLRDYMEYHSDRFSDHSLILRDARGNPAALLPANRREDTLVSHEGLTFGGLITGNNTRVPLLLAAFDEMLTFLTQRSFQRLVYKTIPYTYHKVPTEEDRYALFLCGARWGRCGVLTVVDGENRLPFQERRIRGARKAANHGLRVERCHDFGPFWSLLGEVLLATHGATPVHSLEEIDLLHRRFPDNIKLFGCFEGSSLLGGVVVYESDRVARFQYIAASDRGKELGALDLAFSSLIHEEYRNKRFIDFGTSDEDQGQRLDLGLVDQKQGFGARMVAQDQYEIDLASWEPGRLVRAMS